MSFLKVFLVFLAAAVVVASRDPSSEVSDFLEDHDLPAGLFPTHLITRFHQSSNGTFSMKLEHACYTSLEDEVLWFDRDIQGRISPARIDDLSGVQARLYLVWFPVVSLHVDDARSGYVYLEAGPSYRKVSASGFKYPPRCTKKESFVLLLNKE